MGGQPFERLLEGDPPLLHQVEAIVVDAHRRRHAAEGGEAWTEPQAYRWLRYEDPEPVARLADGARRLFPAAPPDPAAVERAVATAARLGYPDPA